MPWSPLVAGDEQPSVSSSIHVWTEPLCLNLLGPGNGHGTYLDRLYDLAPKTCCGLS